MKAERISFRHAVELLRTDAGYRPSSAASALPAVKSTVRKLAPLVPADADEQAALAQVVGYYHETLKQSPEALAYLTSRGLSSSEMIERFQIGFANRTLGYRLPPMQRAAGRAIRGRLQKLGVLRESGHEATHPALMPGRGSVRVVEESAPAPTREDLFTLLAAEAEEDLEGAEPR